MLLHLLLLEGCYPSANRKQWLIFLWFCSNQVLFLRYFLSTNLEYSDIVVTHYGFGHFYGYVCAEPVAADVDFL